MSKHRTTVFIESDMLQAIRKVAKDDERPMAYHYDKALRSYAPIKKLLTKEVKKVAVKVEVPQEINHAAWLEWAKSPSSKITGASSNKQWKLLAKYNKEQQQLIIDNSINGGYQGLFDLKRQGVREEDFIAKHTNEDWKEGL